jgi:selenocysteine lyase/cysteine desulfurase
VTEISQEKTSVELLVDQRHLFDVPDEVAYFNTANLSPLLRQVAAAGQAAIEQRARPWTITPPDWFTGVEQLRDRAARLFGTDTEGVALIPATSYGLAAAARNLPVPADGRILVLHEEYPSNYYTWQRHAQRSAAELVVVDREPGQSWAEAVLDQLDERVAVVALPNVHWTDGALIELGRVAPVARDAGAALVIDASQSLGALPLDLDELQPDAVVAVGYKWLLGPFSVGYLYLAPHLRDGEPLEENWISRDGSDDFAALVDYTDSYLPGARRFDVGQRTNFGLVPMAVAALDQILAWGVANIAAALQVLNDDLVARITALGLAAPSGPRAPHILGLPIPREAGGRILEALQQMGVSASVRGSALRLAPHLHISSSDCDRLLHALTAALDTAPASAR